MADQNKNRGLLDGFRADFLDCWRRLPSKGLFFGLLAAWLALFHFLGNATLGYINTPSLLRWMYMAYSSGGTDDGGSIPVLGPLLNVLFGGGDDAHGKLIPLVVLGLFWWKRKELLALPSKVWWPALLIVTIALALHVGAYLVQQPKLSIIALFAGIYGLMGLVWGPEWLRASLLPFSLFVFCIPVGSLGENITFPLRLLVTKLAVGISHGILGIDVIREGSQIFDSQRSFRYDVAPACSGIRSLISLLALTTIYGLISFKTRWKRLLMVLVAIPLAVVGNTVRITGVIVVAEAFGQEAGAWFEQKFGFVTFAVALVCVLLLGSWLRERENGPGLVLEAKPV